MVKIGENNKKGSRKNVSAINQHSWGRDKVFPHLGGFSDHTCMKHESLEQQQVVVAPHA